MTKRSIVTLLIIIVLVVMILDFNINGAEVFESYFEQMETESMDNLKNFKHLDLDSERASKLSELIIDSNDVDTLKITNIGSIDINGEKRDDIEVKAVIAVFADRKEQAEEILPRLKIENTKSNGDLTLMLNEIDLPDYINGIRVDYEIKAPEKLALVLKNRFGEMEVANFAAEVNLSNKYKMMRVNNIDAEAVINTRYGNLYVDNIAGNVNIYNRYNEAVIKNLKQDLDMDTKYSSTKLRSIKGKVDIDTNYGELDIDEVRKDININSRYTDIRIMDLRGELEADLKYGGFKLYDIKNNINVNSRYTDLHFKLSPEVDNYLIDCVTEYGNIDSDLNITFTEENNEKIFKGETGTGEQKVQIKVDGRHSDIVIDE